jgi:hypothetical protein
MNPPQAVDARPYQPTVQLLLGAVPVLESQLNVRTKKLLLRVDLTRLEDAHLILRLHPPPPAALLVSSYGPALGGDFREALEALQVDTTALQRSHVDDDFRGIMVTTAAPAGSGYDFYSRYFAPWNGIPEDPVTGSAHTVLYPYWREVIGRSQLRARQCSPRGGDLSLRVHPEDSGRVCMAGDAVLVMEGTLLLPPGSSGVAR